MVPPEKVHPKTFVGANQKFKAVSAVVLGGGGRWCVCGGEGVRFQWVAFF